MSHSKVIRRQLHRLERLALLDTTAAADRARRATPDASADIAKVRERGDIEALIPELPSRWLLPAHAQRPELVALMAEMARSVGARGQRNQQTAMLGRPDSHRDLAKVAVPTLVMCGAARPGDTGGRPRGNGRMHPRFPVMCGTSSRHCDAIFRPEARQRRRRWRAAARIGSKLQPS